MDNPKLWGQSQLFLPAAFDKKSTHFRCFRHQRKPKKALITRPDMHIGFLNDVVDIDMMDNYLLNVVGVKPIIVHGS
ncbi:hypothetical protein ACQ86K_29530 [Mucilaginibacter sp. P19]|uniref:hypothetical protein n=1 Tax=Mucilaginibacter sp. P19 TaxID=3423947 RepID=UPI003D67F21E